MCFSCNITMFSDYKIMTLLMRRHFPANFLLFELCIQKAHHNLSFLVLHSWIMHAITRLIFKISLNLSTKCYSCFANSLVSVTSGIMVIFSPVNLRSSARSSISLFFFFVQSVVHPDWLVATVCQLSK